MVRGWLGQRNCYLVAAEAKHSPCETLEKSICNQEMRSSCLPQGNAGHSQKLPSCAHSCQAAKSHQNTRQAVQPHTETPKSLHETQTGHSQPQFL